MSEIHVTSRGSGKLDGMPSINTSTSLNPFCQSKPTEVCHYCYAKRFEWFRHNIRVCYEKNYRLLAGRLMPYQELPYFDPDITPMVRLHSFGELANDIHYENFCRIAERNPDVLFVLWTKRPNIVERRVESVPENLSLILSIGRLNPTDEYVKDELSRHPLFTAAYVVGVLADGFEPCGMKCISCLRCYPPKQGDIIKQLLH